ncbi:MAG: cation:proton antiporter [Bacteroidales bacterium]|jgi:NhaP-type Na+/H+ or K+/H+ antiporter|nr:cation:proton antiporter [Bacteroidales bacterium]
MQVKNNIKLAIFIIIFLLVSTISYANIIQTNRRTYNTEIKSQSTIKKLASVSEDKNSGNTEEGSKHEKSEHKNTMSSLLFIIIALFIGAATRHFLKKTPLPFTVLLLLIGLGIGILSRLGHLHYWHIFNLQIDVSVLEGAILWAGNINPHIILYVFLPILIFEAAFGMDVHTFKRTFTNSFLLAVPGILIAIFLTAFVILGIKAGGIGLSNWDWHLALLFAAIVSATDPVAVVSILKEIGASKKLATLIEGESLLNDGTAIVLFLVFLALITGNGSNSSPFVQFFKVSFGGVLVGLVIGWIAIVWVKKVFNDALVEITVIIASAYITFFVAESLFHVSGVLGLVTVGLLVGGIGKTRISPEVGHFLHEFWELAAFIANTLIFIIVGVVIANRIVFSAKDFLILGLIYFGIHIVRAIVIFILYPLMRKSGYGLSKKNAYVLWWGALRGAIGLALALIVAGENNIDASIRDQFLFYIAGIVTLTLLINATTIKAFVNMIGLNKIAPSKKLMIINAKNYIRKASENSIEKLKKDRFMKKADWDTVNEYLPEAAQEKIDIRTQKDSDLAETRRRILEKEKSSYWDQFNKGMLSASAVQNLTEAINEIIDANGKISLSERKDLEQLWHTSKYLNKFQSTPILGKIVQRVFFDQLATSYDTARGFVTAQYESLKLIESMALKISGEETEKKLLIVENEINENRIHGLTFLRNLKNTYPEIYKAITTGHAVRANLNYEKKTVDRLLKKGQIGEDECKIMISDIEIRMKRLIDSPPEIKEPEKANLLRTVNWLKDLDKATFNKIIGLFQNRIYAIGEKIIKENAHIDSLYVISRGTVKISKNNKIIDILGKGNVIGEISFLSDIPRTATVTAESPVSVLRLTAIHMQQNIDHNKTLQDKLWEIAIPRLIENIITNIEPFNTWQHETKIKWIKNGEILFAKKVKNLNFVNKIGILVKGGAITYDNIKIKSPSIIKGKTITLSRDSIIFIGE